MILQVSLYNLRLIRRLVTGIDSHQFRSRGPLLYLYFTYILRIGRTGIAYLHLCKFHWKSPMNPSMIDQDNPMNPSWKVLMKSDGNSMIFGSKFSRKPLSFPRVGSDPMAYNLPVAYVKPPLAEAVSSALLLICMLNYVCLDSVL